MSLRQQIPCLLLGLAVVFVVTTYAVQRLVVMPTFEDLERQSALRNVDRTIDAIDRDLNSISATANDWASWDESYQFVAGDNQAFASENLIDESFTNLQIDLVCYIDSQKNIVWGGVRDRESQAWVEVPDLFEAIQAPKSPLTTHASVDDAPQGLMMTSRGPLLVVSRPIITTKREGPIRGSIVMGRFLLDTDVASLAERTHVRLKLWQGPEHLLPQGIQPFWRKAAETGESQIVMTSPQMAHAFAMMKDLSGEPALLVEVDFPRDISAQGKVSAHVATACSMAAGCLTFFAMWWVVKWRIIDPVQEMANQAARIGEQAALKGQIGQRRNDEIGALGREFDRMVKRLSDSHKKLLDTAHRAGMAEIASEVLHHVGNSVNSAHCSIDVLEEALRDSKIDGLDLAVAMLSEHAPHAGEFFEHDPRGPKLVEYFVDLNKSLQREHNEFAAELDRLDDTVRQIREAIAVQQVFAGRTDFRQEVDLRELLDDVIKNHAELLESNRVRLELEVPSETELMLNRNKLRQILSHLVRNAITAMEGVPNDARRLRITSRLVDDQGLELEVCDTGIGFNDEVRGKLFTYGFTTTQGGSGLGLHYCANAIRESGGSISAQSDGAGKGAMFRVRIPRAVTASTLVS